MKMMRVVAAVGVVWLGVVAGLGQGAGPAKRAMTFADLMAMKRVSDPQISPSGKWVMFSVTDVSLEKNTKVNHLWVVPLTGGGGTNAGILPSGQNDNQKTLNDKKSAERQVTSNTGESFGRFSPNGQFVSYTGAPTKDDPVARITIATWDEAAGTVGVGRTLKAVSGDADGAIWSPDSKHLLFTTNVYPECSDKATWAEEDACDKAKDYAAAKSPVKGQVWDSLLYRHWDHYTGVTRSHIIEADFSTDGANPRDLTPAGAVGDAETPTFSMGGPLGYAWAPDSQEIAYVTNLDKVPAASTNNDVFTLRLDEAGAKAVKVSTSPGSDDGPAYSPDGKWLAFRSQARNGFESDKFDLVVMDRESGKIRNLTTTKFDSWVDGFIWTSDSAGISFVYPAAGNESVAGVDVNSKTGPGTQLIGHEGELGDLAFAGQSGLLVGTQMTAARATELFVYDRAHLNPVTVANNEWGGERRLTHINDALFDQLDLAKLESFWFTGAEGTKVQGFLMKPPGFDPAKKYPVKFLMHGGPQTAWGDGWSFRWNWELMAANGYVVVGINRRGSTGYGQKFVDEVSGDWGGRAYVDLMKGLDYAEAKYPFMDKTRECALGASYGGFMADWVLTHTNRFKCIVTHDGLYDPASAYGDTEEMWFNEWEFRRAEDFPKGWDGFVGGSGAAKTNAGVLRSAQNDNSNRDNDSVKGGGDAGRPAMPWRYAALPAEQDPFRKWSPMLHIQDARTPTLVIHSQKDYRLDVSQGMALFTALQRLGVPSRMLYFPDEGHWVMKPKNSQMWNEVVSDWCDQWTKTGKYAEAGR